MFGKNWILNKNYWDVLDIIYKERTVRVKKRFHNFAYISAIVGPILTRFRPQLWHRGRQKKNDLSSDLENVGQGHH